MGLSPKSIKELSICHVNLRVLFGVVDANGYPFKVIEGHRGAERQDLLFRLNKTNLHYPNSKHNRIPSFAADAYPTPIIWNDFKAFYHFGGYVRGIADQLYKSGKMKHKLIWGGDWNNNFNLNDQNFDDLGHFELEDEMEECLTFSEALEALKDGKKIQRQNWNGPDQFLMLQHPDANSKMTLPYIYITTVQGDLVPWLASQTDLIEDDWVVVE